MIFEKYIHLLSVFCFSLALSSCGGGGDSSTNTKTEVIDEIIDDASPKLTWLPPSTRENGEPLSPSEIEGYYLYTVNLRTDDEQMIYVEEDGSSSFSLEDFSIGSYEVSIATIDTDGLRSDFSEPVDISL